jgi:hypothetical protein
MQSYIQPACIDYHANNRHFLTHVNRVRAVVREYERFKVAVMRVIPPVEGYDAVTLLEAAYRKLACVDPFDLTDPDRQHWTECMLVILLVLPFIRLIFVDFIFILVHQSHA